jgi:hypothetical protein
MGIEHLPRNKQRHPAEPSLRVVENTDCAVSLPEENDAPSPWSDEHSYDMHSLLEENALLRRILVKMDLVLKRSLTQSNVASVYARTVTICGSAGGRETTILGADYEAAARSGDRALLDA